MEQEPMEAQTEKQYLQKAAHFASPSKKKACKSCNSEQSGAS
jgi:hypothetical protein